jgi:hypothetical protein
VNCAGELPKWSGEWGQFNSSRAALWDQVEAAFNERRLARLGA